FQRFRPEPLDPFRAPFDAAELARVVVNQNAAVKRKNSMRVVRLPRIDKQFSRHSKVDREESLIERNQDELASPPDASNRTARNLLRELLAIAGRNEF